MYMGVELEVDEGGKDSGNARKILSVLNQNAEYGYIKSDGSLDDGLAGHASLHAGSAFAGSAVERGIGENPCLGIFFASVLNVRASCPCKPKLFRKQL